MMSMTNSGIGADKSQAENDVERIALRNDHAQYEATSHVRRDETAPCSELQHKFDHHRYSKQPYWFPLLDQTDEDQ